VLGGQEETALKSTSENWERREKRALGERKEKQKNKKADYDDERANI
jgi:hypothetical protein